MLSERIPPLMSMLPAENLELNTDDITGGLFDLIDSNPFQSGASEGLFSINCGIVRSLFSFGFFQLHFDWISLKLNDFFNAMLLVYSAVCIAHSP